MKAKARAVILTVVTIAAAAAVLSVAMLLYIKVAVWLAGNNPPSCDQLDARQVPMGACVNK